MAGVSTAVVPFFRVRLALAYRCRACTWERRFFKDISRETRMILLANHLRDAHGIGPLARETVP